ncbi:unnamed protein product [Alternaria alternata]
MSSAACSSRLQEQGIQVSREDVKKVGRPFRNGYSDGKPFEELVLDIEGALRSLIGKPKKDERHERNTCIALIVKMLTKERTVVQVTEYLQSEEGANWLRHLAVPEAPTVALRIVNTADAPEDPAIAIAGPELVILEDATMDAQDLHASLPTDAFPASIEGLTNTAGPFETVVPTVTQPLSPMSPHQSSAHSRTPSDVSIDFSTGWCPRCNQRHNNLNRLVEQTVQRVLEQQSSALLRDPPRRQRLNSTVISQGVVFVLLVLLIQVLPRLLSKWS